MVLRIIRSFPVHNEVGILFTLFIFLSSSCFSQAERTINLKEVHQKTVRKYIIARKIDQMPDFSLIHASWKKGTDESGFNVREKIFFLKYRLSNVWDCYRHVNTAKAWNKQSIRLGLLISKRSNTATYTSNKTFPDLDTGQVYFLKLKLIKGLLNIPVAFEITNIDFDRQLFEFSYIDNNKSRGKQTIQFFENGEGHTRIVHRSYFKSQSQFRDNLLYPYFHKKFIKEFHRNMKHLVRNSDRAIASSR